jgi:hypothetical protein
MGVLVDVKTEAMSIAWPLMDFLSRTLKKFGIMPDPQTA